MLKEKKSIWLVVVLIILLSFIAIYIGVKGYKKYKEEIEVKAYQQGMEDAILDMYEMGAKCEPITIISENNEQIMLISVDCLEKKEE
jgi:hypothetical protein